MKKAASRTGRSVEEGSGNVDAGLGYRDSKSMLVKAHLAAKIAGILKLECAHPDPRRQDLGFNSARGFRPIKGAVSRDFQEPAERR